ncbi:unnamed protein product [Rotaria sp. Silwood2]|nr:unnamed protein product [Rotaria sp. Silwood2]CAF3113469.1 unnamed protein product [Rotaria sp. Silwood2]CAF4253518.1 unnamed protein product [Rotaria sp. Silwood2]CAF4421057.1 unnamed protein product [Rotaria sp. Silwood2]
MNVSTVGLTILITALLSFSSVKSELPACFQGKFRPIEGPPALDAYTQINIYLYHGRKTYLVIPAFTYNQMISLFDEDCNYICAPFGGFTGLGDGKCVDFKRDAKPSGTIWAGLPFK